MGLFKHGDRVVVSKVIARIPELPVGTVLTSLQYLNDELIYVKKNILNHWLVPVDCLSHDVNFLSERIDKIESLVKSLRDELFKLTKRKEG